MEPEFVKQCFGVNMEQLKANIERSTELQCHAMLAMSILSDAQELIERGDTEQARQFINQSKYIISEYWMDDSRAKHDAMIAQKIKEGK